MKSAGKASHFQTSGHRSVQSKKDMQNIIVEKQRRLMQLGYSKDVINNNSKVVNAFGGNRNTISTADDYMADQGVN